MKIILIISFFIFNLMANERIISLSPSITEIIYALKKGDKLIATSSYSLYPKEAKKLPIIGGYTNPNLEKIINFSPTLVVGQDFNKETLEKLKKFNIKTLELNLDKLNDIKKSISLLAREINSNFDKKLISDINNAINNAPKSKKPHSVMIVYGLRENLNKATYIAGKDIFFDDIIKECGNFNVYTSNLMSQPILNYENIIALNPDQIIILHSLATESNVDVNKALKAWYSIPTTASLNKKISVINENYLHIPSHRVALTAKKLCLEMNN